MTRGETGLLYLQEAETHLGRTESQIGGSTEHLRNSTRSRRQTSLPNDYHSAQRDFEGTTGPQREEKQKGLHKGHTFCTNLVIISD